MTNGHLQPCHIALGSDIEEPADGTQRVRMTAKRNVRLIGGEPAQRRSCGCADGGTADPHLHYENADYEGMLTKFLHLTDILELHFP